jgi:hypothetical protein
LNLSVAWKAKKIFPDIEYFSAIDRLGVYDFDVHIVLISSNNALNWGLV